jgi:hypothetical protein
MAKEDIAVERRGRGGGLAEFAHEIDTHTEAPVPDVCIALRAWAALDLKALSLLVQSLVPFAQRSVCVKVALSTAIPF